MMKSLQLLSVGLFAFAIGYQSLQAADEPPTEATSTIFPKFVLKGVSLTTAAKQWNLMFKSLSPSKQEYPIVTTTDRGEHAERVTLDLESVSAAQAAAEIAKAAKVNIYWTKGYLAFMCGDMSKPGRLRVISEKK